MTAKNTCHHLCIVKRFCSFLLAGGISYSHSCYFTNSYSNAIYLSMKYSVLQDKKQRALSPLHPPPLRPQLTRRCSLQRALGELKALWGLHSMCSTARTHTCLKLQTGDRDQQRRSSCAKSLEHNDEEFSLQHRHSLSNITILSRDDSKEWSKPVTKTTDSHKSHYL